MQELHLITDMKMLKRLLVEDLAISAAMFFGAFYSHPLRYLFKAGGGNVFVRLMAVLAVAAIYVFLHELMHAAVMKLFGAGHVKLQFTFGYASTCSTDYYDRLSYITVALAPVVILGAALIIASVYADREWFWVFYTSAILNFSGSCGDYEAIRFLSGMPKNMLLSDNGISLSVYTPGDV